METSQPDTATKVNVSVIIPCYNQGKWLWEAIDSVLAQDVQDFEIIVVNDGSTDPVTRRIVSEIKHPKVKVMQTVNQGLAQARNEGIRQAVGRWILPLDSDDRLHPTYIRKACGILEQEPDIGIVYCRAEWFGEQQGLWNLEPFSFPGILLSPQIFASSMFRKSDWERVGGYKSDMIYGWEDYDFWLSLIGLGVGVHQIDEVLFYYRKTEGSMAGLEKKHMLYSFRKLFEHHRELYEANIGCLFEAVIASKHIRDLEKLRMSDVFEVFIPDREGYAGRNIREQNYPQGVWSRISILLNHVPESGMHLLRLDPCQKPGVVDIASVKLLHASSGQTLFALNANSQFAGITLGNHTHRLGDNRVLRLFCATGDSHFFLPSIDREILTQPVILEVWIYQHPGLEAVGDFCDEKIGDLHARELAGALQSNLRAHEVQAESLKKDLASQCAHSTELEKINESLRVRFETAKAETEQAKLLVQTLQSEIRQCQQKVDLLATQLNSAEADRNQARKTLEAMEQDLQNSKPRKGLFFRHR